HDHRVFAAVEDVDVVAAIDADGADFMEGPVIRELAPAFLHPIAKVTLTQNNGHFILPAARRTDNTDCTAWCTDGAERPRCPSFCRLKHPHCRVCPQPISTLAPARPSRSASHVGAALTMRRCC